jgi:FkbM family methyltransferase
MFSYAQNFEDVILARLFDGKTDGLYVDIGASDPELLSVTKHFYDLGWSGVNVEPIKAQWDLFATHRPRDINLNAAIGNGGDKIVLTRMLGNSALSTTNSSRSGELIDLDKKYELCEVDLVTANSLFEKYISREVDFLKIDVEGAEADVLFSLDFSVHRPKVLVIEAVKPLESRLVWSKFDVGDVASWQEWEGYVLSHNYILAYFDGLNKFYVKKECASLLPRFAIPPGVFDYIVPDTLKRGLTIAEEKEKVIQDKEVTIQTITVSLQAKDKLINDLHIAMHTLRSSIGLTVRLGVFLNRSWIFRKVARFSKRLVEIFSPRLGNLNQYTPRPMTQPQKLASRARTKNFPKISIVTPSYQQAAFIERTLTSVLAQNYSNLEYFVQDGGSTDATPALLTSHSKHLSGWRSEPDGGQSQALNRGFSKTSGEIMAWLNSDDLLLPDSLEAVAEFFSSHPEVDVVYGNRLLIDENDMEIGRWVMPWHDNKVLSWADYIPQETLFWRRRIWDKAGGQIDESFRFAMDWDLLIRFRDAGARFAHIPRFLGAFRIHAHQKTSALINEIGFQEMNRLRERALGRAPTRQEIRRACLPFIFKHITVDLAYRMKRSLRGAI